MIRECREELGVEIEVLDLFMEVEHTYPDLSVQLLLYHAKIKAGNIQKLEHEDIRWITVSEINDLPFCPADEEILRRIKEVYS